MGQKLEDCIRGYEPKLTEDYTPSSVHCNFTTGAAGTGKTLAILHKINFLCWTYPGARVLIVRRNAPVLSPHCVARTLGMRPAPLRTIARGPGGRVPAYPRNAGRNRGRG